MYFGIDYGSKLAGTTAVCFQQGQHLQLQQSEKKKDADAFINQLINHFSPKAIYIDAPISLPLAYFGKGDNFFYRLADRDLRAMSPMFLGGLTARAMKLRQHWSPKISFFEIYPSALRALLLPTVEGYKKELHRLPDFNALLINLLPLEWETPPQNWHQTDAVLAWLSGYRHQRGEGRRYGTEEEGVIWV